MASAATEIGEISVVITICHTGMAVTMVKCAPWMFYIAENLLDPKKPPQTGWRYLGSTV